MAAGSGFGNLSDDPSASKTADPPLANPILALAAGERHTCALLAPGDVRCWGSNQYLQLGEVSKSQQRLSPLGIAVMGGVRAITSGTNHTCALLETGGVRCWGFNIFGVLGQGNSTLSEPIPQFDVMTGVRAIAAGAFHTCALTEAGGVRCWGSNDEGILGDGCQFDVGPCANRFTPPETNVLEGIQAIAAGSKHTCALTVAGGVRCWGSNDSGQLGIGTKTDLAVPPETDVLTDVKAIFAGGSTTCALMNSTAIRCWGDNSYGQLGDGTCPRSLGTCEPRTSPQTSDVLTGVTSLAIGSTHVCALMATAGVRCWGADGYGELGDGGCTINCSEMSDSCKYLHVERENASCAGQSIPPPNDILLGAQAIAAGRFHTCAVMATGGVQCWGANDMGQIGNGTTTESRIPVPVIGLSQPL